MVEMNIARVNFNAGSRAGSSSCTQAARNARSPGGTCIGREGRRAILYKNTAGTPGEEITSSPKTGMSVVPETKPSYN
ncbi:hypothetical protein E2C01_033557 [Portunus trituberculatus]|uniref:Uncharacterized protein n=1 Tax=Portunus trituberculatus TaxID=210409 RepID=A0A5B7F4I6_PORTR|nr:hypothetical protein [Portunus trituberculatus]